MSQLQCSGGLQDGHNDQNEAAAYMHSNPFRVDKNVARVMPLNPNWMFTHQQQQAQYYPYFPYVLRRAHFPSASTNIALSVSTSLDIAAHENSSCSNSAPSTSANNTNSNPNNGAKTSNKWSEAQTSVLVNKWKERIDELAMETWHNIVRAVCNVGTLRTAKQCKDKIRNLKLAHKTQRPTTRPDDHTKPVPTTTLLMKFSVCGPSGQMNDSESEEESDDSLLPGESDSESSPSSAKRQTKWSRKRKRRKAKEEPKKKRGAEKESEERQSNNRDDRFDREAGGNAELPDGNDGEGTETCRRFTGQA
ncbi:Hypothetical predicted protein [Paramuricea clavata]|uniref:Myb/SANT-like DNA-binding domain-containing protein n=1 Tax=Paramuricea clavata TaxID=317549 RepID=A0A7D9LK34_PARCT|nr:Hypothetical predicted protein [Paramuricea clavata]